MRIYLNKTDLDHFSTNPVFTLAKIGSWLSKLIIPNFVCLTWQVADHPAISCKGLPN